MSLTSVVASEPRIALALDFGYGGLQSAQAERYGSSRLRLDFWKGLGPIGQCIGGRRRGCAAGERVGNVGS